MGFVASIVTCVGPFIFALLGLGGAGLLVKFEPYQPHFVAATFIILGSAFYLTYRKPKANMAISGRARQRACPPPGANRAGKIRLWITTVFVVGIISFPYLTQYLFS